MENIEEMNVNEQSSSPEIVEVTWELILEKGKEADAAVVEVQRIEAEISRANDEKQVPDDAEGKAIIEKLIPDYRAAIKKMNDTENEWLGLLERYNNQR